MLPYLLVSLFPILLAMFPTHPNEIINISVALAQLSDHMHAVVFERAIIWLDDVREHLCHFPECLY